MRKSEETLFGSLFWTPEHSRYESELSDLTDPKTGGVGGYRSSSRLDNAGAIRDTVCCVSRPSRGNGGRHLSEITNPGLREDDGDVHV